MSEELHAKIEDWLMKLVEYEDGRKDELQNGLNRRDMGRGAQIFLMAKQIMQLIQQERVKAQEEVVKKIREFYMVIPEIDADYSEFPPSMLDVRYVVKQALDLNFKKLLNELKQSLAEKGGK